MASEAQVECYTVTRSGRVSALNSNLEAVSRFSLRPGSYSGGRHADRTQSSDGVGPFLCVRRQGGPCACTPQGRGRSKLLEGR